jgi:hypothetical protein
MRLFSFWRFSGEQSFVILSRAFLAFLLKAVAHVR